MHHEKNTTHPAHPFRNFLYTLYSLLNAAAFTLFFYLLFMAERPANGTLVMIACGALVALGLFFGVLKPLFHK